MSIYNSIRNSKIMSFEILKRNHDALYDHYTGQ